MPNDFSHCVALDSLIQSVDRVGGVEKIHLNEGDILFARTRNSTYRIRSLGGNAYEVSGGWFDKKGLSPARTSIAGCTWGGSAIMTSLAVATGLCIEFGNRLITSRVSTVHLIRKSRQN